MEIGSDVLQVIGKTPLVRLGHIHPPGNLVAKVEHTNPGGSIKERIAVAMVDRAEREGLLRPGGWPARSPAPSTPTSTRTPRTPLPTSGPLVQRYGARPMARSARW